MYATTTSVAHGDTSSTSSVPFAKGESFREQVYMVAAGMQQHNMQPLHHQPQSYTMTALPVAANQHDELQDAMLIVASSSSQLPTNAQSAAPLSKTATQMRRVLPKYVPRIQLMPPQIQAFQPSEPTGSSTTTQPTTVAGTLLPSGKTHPKPQKHTHYNYATILFNNSSEFIQKKTGGVTMPFLKK